MPDRDLNVYERSQDFQVLAKKEYTACDNNNNNNPPDFKQLTDMPLGGQRRILSQSGVEKLTEKLDGTNYKLVRIDEHGGVTEPSNVMHLGAITSGAPNSRDPLREYPPFELKYCEKPHGTAGKSPPDGYNLQDASGLSKDHHRVLTNLVELELKETPGINMHATIDNQRSKSLVESVILLIAEKYTEFKMYEDDGHWLLRAYVYVVLKKSKEQYIRLQRAARIKMDPTQLEVQEAKRAKDREDARERGRASARKRKAKKEAAAAILAAPTEAQAATNKGNDNTPEPVARDFLDDKVEAIAQDISMMSIHIPSSGEELMDTDEGNFVLPADITAPPVLSSLQPPSTVIPNPLDMQRLVRLLVLSEEERALLPENLRLALALIGTFGAGSSPAPALAQAGAPAPTPTATSAPCAHALAMAPVSAFTPALVPPSVSGPALPDLPAASPATISATTLTGALQSVPARRPRMQPPPFQTVPESKAAYTPISTTATVPVPAPLVPAPAPLVPASLASPVTVADSASAISRQMAKARMIDQIEPGPTVLQIDHDTLSELSSDSDLPEEEGNAKEKGKGKGKAGPGRGRGGGRGRGCGRGCGGSHGGGQPEPAKNVEPEPAPATTRRLRSKK